MRISLIALTALVALAHTAAHADATIDLFAAIKEQNVEKVAKALEAGADTNSKRSIDGHSAKTFALKQFDLVCHTPVPLLASSTSSLALLMASFLGNKVQACLSAAGLITGASLSAYIQNTPEEEHNIIQKMIAKLYLDKATTYASTAGLLASAWASERYVLSTIGTIGLATLYYQANKGGIAFQIYSMIDPELSLIS